MDEMVGEDDRLGAEKPAVQQGRQDGAIGLIAGIEDQRRLGALQHRQLGLDVLM